MAEPELIEDFYGVYILYNINPKYKGRTYIGYTRDPNRRIMQHNRGTWAGGAYRTSNRGPWKMVMIVHGFPNNISALRFEWAWQNPNKTTRLQHLDLKKIPRKETEFQFKLRVLSEMLRVGPWCSLPLTIRWLENDYREDFPPERKPPTHMTTVQGPVKSHNHKKVKGPTSIPTIECLLCSGYLKETEKLSCVNPNCDLVSHITCLANLFLTPGDYIPISGNCPFCNMKLKWGDLIRKMNGCDRGVKDNHEDNGNNEVFSTENEGFDNSDDEGDLICTQDDLNDNDKVAVNWNREFVDDFNIDDDIICTQDIPKDHDVILTQSIKNDFNSVSTKHRVLSNDDVICTDDNKADDRNDDESDDEVLFKRDKAYDEQPSWFLDCNENL